MRFLGLPLLLSLLWTCQSTQQQDLSSTPYVPTPHELAIPPDFFQMTIPPDNPLTEEGIALGRRLFYDPILSIDSTLSCSSCHDPQLSFTDGQATSKGFGGQNGRRSAMSLLNVGFYDTGLFWDGRVATLEEQALLPVEDAVELHETWPNVEAKLRRHEHYPQLFRQAFGIQNKGQISRELAVKAIAQFERTLMSSGQSRYDRFRRGELEPTEDERMGYDLFFDISPEVKDADCGNCHNAPLFTTNEYENNGLEMAADLASFSDAGRGAVVKNSYQNGKFRIPSLRNIELTAPYMHDGRFKTLEEVIAHYNHGGHPSPNVNSLVRPLGLTEKEQTQL
ncbi:MAG: cytochrome c peroxidase, partial [Bacteroidota bacterium]